MTPACCWSHDLPYLYTSLTTNNSSREFTSSYIQSIIVFVGSFPLLKHKDNDLLGLDVRSSA
jgi:hypothetical protein